MDKLTQRIEALLEKYPEPGTGKPLMKTGRISGLRLDGGVVKFVIDFASMQDARDFEGLRAELAAEIRALDGVEDVQIVSTASNAGTTTKQSAHSNEPPPQMRAPGQSQQAPIPGIKHIYAIASGKGGVGKSTVTSNLALALAQSGKSIGLLDADLYGPSQARMMGTRERPERRDGRIIPITAHGVRLISVGQIIEDGEALIWRGPMLTKMLDQFLREVDWGELDALLIDLPPGTGDVQLSLAQRTKLSGAIIVSTPQDIALIDVRRAISMFERLKVPVIGLIENMATHICPKCGHEERIFGSNGVESEAKARKLPYLGAIPLDMEICKSGDSGQPLALKPGSIFGDIAGKLIKAKKL